MPHLNAHQLQRSSSVSPRLWIQSIALFSSFSPAAKFQEITFTRGLNLIVGLDSPNPKQEDDLGGHSVGKTTLCRLIRYCLGEPTFATSQDQKLIRENFSQGWVGCELYLDGVLWSILLPFDKGTQGTVPRAGMDETLENIFTQEKADNQYSLYQQALEALLPPSAARTDVHFEWRHLLAWLTRDQKCIQDNFWNWRTAESESGSPQHRNRKKEGGHLARSVLGLLVSEENKLREELAKLQDELKKAEEAAAEAAVLPELHKNLALRQLNAYQTISGIKTGEPLPEGEFLLHLQKEEVSIQKLEQEHSALCSELATVKQRQKYFRKLREHQQNLLEPQKGYLEGLRLPQTEDPSLAEIKEVEDRECPAAILYKDCERIKEVRSFLEQKQRGLDLAAIMGDKEYQRVNATVTGIERNIQEALVNEADAEQRATDLKKDKIPSAYKKLMAAYRRQDAQKAHWEALRDAWGVLYFNTPNTVHQQAVQAVKQLEEERSNQEMALSIARRENLDKAKALASYFDGLVKKIINTKFSGKFTAGDDLKFSVYSHGELSGEALNVARTVLGDFASMLYGIETGLHPGFLVHDSPRQADMALSWYQRILAQAAEESESSGGQENATFQYIITTTTAPCENLKQYVRKEFASVPSEMLLFKRRLSPPQGELPSDSD